MNGPGFEISVDRQRDMVTVTYVGRLSLDVAKLALDAAAGHPDVGPSTLVLLDTTQAIVHEIDVDWLRHYQAYRESRGYPSRLTALVVSGDEGHQMLGHLWAAMRATTGAATPGVFTDTGAAAEWLVEQRTAGSGRTLRA